MPSVPTVGAGPSAAYVDPYAGYLVYDTFTDDDATALADHTPEKKPSGAVWSEEAGSWTIQSNRARGSDAADARALIETGEANITAQATIIFGDGTWPGVFVRGIDGANLLMAMANKSTGKANIFKRVTGGWTDLGEVGSGLTWADDDTIKFSCDDDDLLTMYQNDVSLGSTTDATHNTATEAGLRHSDGGTTQDHDDFWVTSP